MKNLNAVLSVLVLSVISTACGNVQNQGGLNKSSYGTSTTISTSAQEQCSTSANVVGQGYNNSLQTQYRVCVSSTSTATANTIQIFAEDQVSRNVAIYPVRIVGNLIAIYPSYAQSVTLRTAGTQVSFGALAANAVYVVDSAAVAKFNQCISYSASGNGSLSACASNNNISLNYAYGQF